VLAQPHPGISEPQKMSATVSVLNCIGHRDAAIAQPLAKKLAAELNCVVVIACGIHFEHFTPKIQKDVLDTVDLMEKEILRKWMK
jgi:hypothetical protein